MSELSPEKAWELEKPSEKDTLYPLKVKKVSPRFEVGVLKGQKDLIPRTYPYEESDIADTAHESERYSLIIGEERVAKHSIASVHDIWDARLGRVVKGKTTLPKNRGSMIARKMIRNEALFLAKAQEVTDATPKIHDLIETEDGPMIIMEKVHGPTLQDLDEISPELALQIALVVGVALQDLHREELYSHDLSDHNIVLDKNNDYRPVMIDFNISPNLNMSRSTSPSFAEEIDYDEYHQFICDLLEKIPEDKRTGEIVKKLSEANELESIDEMVDLFSGGA